MLHEHNIETLKLSQLRCVMFLRSFCKIVERQNIRFCLQETFLKYYENVCKIFFGNVGATSSLVSFATLQKCKKKCKYASRARQNII